MKESLANSIMLHQQKVNELHKIKRQIKDNISQKVKFNIITEHLCVFDINIEKRKTKLDISNDTMLVIIDTAIKREKELIDKLIDDEVKKRNKK